MLKKLIILFSSLLLLQLSLSALPLEDTFQEAVNAFENKDYETSLGLFLRLENEGVHNPDLYYNIGNCYFRLGSIGRSVLYYRRALILDLDHKAANRNLEYVLTYTQDKQSEEETDLISSIWLKVRNSLSLNTLAILLLVLFLVSIVLLILMLTRYRLRDKTSLIFLFSIIIIFTFVIGTISYAKYTARNDHSEAVLIDTSAIGYSGPGEDFTRVFTIHEGMIFEVEKTESDWSLIKLSNGLGGWIKKDTYLKI